MANCTRPLTSDRAIRNVVGIVFSIVLALFAAADQSAGETSDHASQTEAFIGRLTEDERDIFLFDLMQHIDYTDLPYLHQALRLHPKSTVRWRVALALGHLGSPTSISTMTAVLRNDPSEDVRWATVRAIAQIGRDSAAPALEERLDGDQSPRVRARAARSLADIEPSIALPVLERSMATERDPEVKVVVDSLIKVLRYGGTVLPLVQPGMMTTGSYEGTTYYIYVPTSYDPAKKHDLLVSVHGTRGTAQRYIQNCWEVADMRDTILLAPYFDEATWPAFFTLNLTGTGIGGPRSDLVLLEIVGQLNQILNVKTDRFYLFGHSQGGQFVQMFAYAHSDRIIRAAAAGSGYYLLPNDGDMFPNGTLANPWAPDLADRIYGEFLATPMSIIVGTEDIERRKDAFEQFKSETSLYAAKHHVTSNFVFRTVQGGEHRGEHNFPTAATYLFIEQF